MSNHSNNRSGDDPNKSVDGQLNGESESTPPTSPIVDWKRLINECLRFFKTLREFLDSMCKDDHEPGPWLFFRIIFTLLGFMIPPGFYVITLLGFGDSFADMPEFFRVFWRPGWIFVFVIFIGLAIMIAHNAQRSYCRCITSGIWWSAVIVVPLVGVSGMIP